MSDGVNVHKTSNDQGKEGVVTAYEVIRKDLPRKITPDRKHDMRDSQSSWKDRSDREKSKCKYYWWIHSLEMDAVGWSRGKEARSSAAQVLDFTVG